MIQSQELRIGNYFTIDGSIYQVSQITKEFFNGHLVKEASGMRTNGGRRNPIPLTPEILEKAGFEKIQHWSYSSGEKIEFFIYTKKDLTYNCLQKLWWYGPVLKTQPEYLHQLQNLYWCLCGEELEIKL